MIIAVDIETQGLDCTKFIMGCVIKEKTKKAKYFYKKEDLWEYILKLGKTLAKQNKVLNVYSHNATYDFYGYADLTDKNIKYFSHQPFIVAYKWEGREIIKFLDSWAIFKMPLKKLGEITGIQKHETPEWLLTKQEKGTLTNEELETLTEYCERDTKIVLNSILYMKKLLKEKGVKIKRLYTINQIAIQWFLTKLKEQNEELKEQIFWDENNNELRRTLRASEIHEAYRGARNECWKLGKHQNTTYIDVNNLYGWASINMKFPNLKTERKTDRPLTKGFTKQEIIQQIGITRCIVKNHKNNIGLLPIRTPTGNYYPKCGKILIGTWTNQELELAEQEGYEILDIQWTVNYSPGQNPYKKITTELWQARKNSNTEFEKYFYKQMMNSSYGKLGQTRINQEIFLESIDKAKEYLNKKFKIISSHGYDVLYINQTTTQTLTKKYYAPIIPTLINATARIKMYHDFKKIPQEDLIYTDTDSIIFYGDHANKFEIKNELGAYKIVNHNEETLVFGKKTYRSGEEIKISGIRKQKITKEAFDSGIVTSEKMKTLKTEQNIQEIGKFYEETRNLKEQTINHTSIQDAYDQEKVYIDNNLNNIAYFIPTLKRHIEDYYLTETEDLEETNK